MALENNTDSSNSAQLYIAHKNRRFSQPPETYPMKFNIRYDVPFPYYQENNDGVVDNERPRRGSSQSAGATTVDHRRRVEIEEMANGLSAIDDLRPLLFDKELWSLANMPSPLVRDDKSSASQQQSKGDRSKFIDSTSTSTRTNPGRKAAVPNADDEHQREHSDADSSNSDLFDTSPVSRKSSDEHTTEEESFASCHLHEVEMILERISSSTAMKACSETSPCPYGAAVSEEGSTAINGKTASRWRDLFLGTGPTSHGGGTGGGGGRLNRKRGESLVGKKKMSLTTNVMMSGGDEKPKTSVTRSQSMRYHNTQTRSATKLVAMFLDSSSSSSNTDNNIMENGGGCSRQVDTPIHNISGVSPARSNKITARKMDSNPMEFRKRTGSIPNRHDRRSQSMRMPSRPPGYSPAPAFAANTATIDRRPRNLPTTEDSGDFERLRTFALDPSKPGSIINRGDSFRRRSNTGASLRVRPQSEKSTEAISRVPSGTGLVDATLPPSAATTASHGRKSLSPISPTSPEAFMTPPESMTPCTNGHVVYGVRKYGIIVVGVEHVGKTSMIKQFMTSEYCNPFQSDADENVPLDNTVSVLLNGEESRLSFFELDHQNEIWKSLKGDGYLIVYSIDDALSFRNAKKLVHELRRHHSKRPAILVANKIDLERKRQVTADDGRSLAKEYDCKFVEIAVALGHHVDELLVGILAQVRQNEEELAHAAEIEGEVEVFANGIDDDDDDDDENDAYRPVVNSLTARPTPKSASTTEMSCLRFSPSRQSNIQQQPRRTSTKRRKRLSTSKTSEDNSSVSPPTSCSNLTAVGHRFVQKMFGRRRSSRSLEDLLTLA